MFVVVAIVVAVTRLQMLHCPRRRRSRPSTRCSGPAQRCRGEAGQTTAEYALVLIGAAAVALLFIAWATRTDRIGALFDFVMDEIMGRAR